MPANRVFPRENVKTKAADYHGAAQYERTLPNIAATGAKSVNIELAFEEALKLSLALQSCLSHVNRYNRASAAGRQMGVLLSLKTGNTSISVIERRVRPAANAKG